MSDVHDAFLRSQVTINEITGINPGEHLRVFFTISMPPTPGRPSFRIRPAYGFYHPDENILEFRSNSSVNDYLNKRIEKIIKEKVIHAIGSNL